MNEFTLRIVVELPGEVVDLLERLVVTLEDEYEQRYGGVDEHEDEIDNTD